MFTKSLQDVVKGIRANKHNPAAYISGVVADIKEELGRDDDSKANAIEKLTYLQLEGYDMSWANFNIIECMSMPWFGHKHVGYLAAAQSFYADTDVILLTTNLFRKAFAPSGADMHAMWETGAAISCLSNICNRDLAKSLLNDIYGMLNSARPYTRKKAVLVLYKFFKVWPKALRLSFPRLREKLHDEDLSVRSAAVYVVCELARNNPQRYLELAPEFFEILKTANNNWILIKIVKLMGSLVPLEPRLAKKLREPLTEIITTTPAKSLLYECVNTLISGRITSKSIVSLCMDKLRTFIEDTDQNLKYLGLLGLHKLMQQHLRVVAEHKNLVLDCLEDEDPTIRRRAIDIITCMVSRKNMNHVIERLLRHLNNSEGDYRNYVMSKIITICSQENYSFISDFAWYVDTLLELSAMVGISKDNAVSLRKQFVDILVRVRGVRKYAVKHLTAILLDVKKAASTGSLSTTALPEVLYAAAWAVGEYPKLVPEPMKVIAHILDPFIQRLEPTTQIVYLHAAVKIGAHVLQRLLEEGAGGPDEPLPMPEGDAKASAGETKTDAKSDAKVPLATDGDGGAKAVMDLMGLMATEPLPARGDSAATPVRRQDAKSPPASPGDDGARGQPDQGSAMGSPVAEAKAVDGGRADESIISIDFKATAAATPSPRRKGRILGEGQNWRLVAQEAMQELASRLEAFMRSGDIEVQERAVGYSAFIRALLGIERAPNSDAFAGAGNGAGNSDGDSSDDSEAEARKKKAAAAAAASSIEEIRLNLLQLPAAQARAAIERFVSFFGSLDQKDKLGMVHPKAQRRVKVPAGLDLDAWINEPEPDSEEEVDDDDNWGEGFGKSGSGRGDRDWGGIFDSKDAKRRRGGRSRLGGDSDARERKDRDEYLEALRAKREKDPYYLKGDDGANEGKGGGNGGTEGSDESGDESRARSMGERDVEDSADGGKKSRKKKKKARRRRARVESDDLPDQYVVAAGPKLEGGDSDDEYDGDGKKRDKGLDIDVLSPLKEDERIPVAQSYTGARSEARKYTVGAGAPARDSSSGKKRKKKKDKKSKRDKKKKKKSSRGEEQQQGSSPANAGAVADILNIRVDEDQPTGQQSSDRGGRDGTAETKTTMDILDLSTGVSDKADTPTALGSASPVPDLLDAKGPSSNSTTVAGGLEALRAQLLYRDDAVCISFTTRADPRKSTRLILSLRFVSLAGTVESARVDFSGTYEGPTQDRPSPKPSTVEVENVNSGSARAAEANIKWKTFDGPRALPTTVYYKLPGGGRPVQRQASLRLGCSSFLEPVKISMNDLSRKLIGESAAKTYKFSTKLALPGLSIPTALRAVSAVLNVELVMATPGAATYYGKSTRREGQFVAIFVKANKGDQSQVFIELKASDRFLADNVLVELSNRVENLSRVSPQK